MSEGNGGAPSADPVRIEQVRDALMGVVDPEIGLDIVELGLIYAVEIREREVKVQMTLTSPVCPYGPEIVEAARSYVREIPGVRGCDVELVWEPNWDPRTMASKEAKMALGLFDDF
jgi:metal-sulfur cluster biosynthetic enzyme